VEIAGSNPAWDAFKKTQRRGTQTGKAATTTLRAVPETLVTCRFDSDLRHSNNEQHASVGHWPAQVAVTHPPSGFAGSTPARRTEK
jgi:hypothetical protein